MQRFIGQIVVDPKGYDWEWPEEVPRSAWNPRLRYRSDAQWNKQIRRRPKEAWDVTALSDAKIYDPFSDEPALFIKLARIGFPERNEPNDPWFAKIVDFANRYGSVGHPYNTITQTGEDCSTAFDWRLALEVLWRTFAEAQLLPSSGAALHREPSASLRKARELVAEKVLLGGIPVWARTIGARAGARQFGFVVYDLWDVVRLQMSMALLGDSRIRECPTCDQPFEISAQRGRSDKQFCSQNCRVKWYQRKKSRARQLQQEGWTLPQIAEELESKVQTVKGWLSK